MNKLLLNKLVICLHSSSSNKATSGVPVVRTTGLRCGPAIRQ